MNQILKSFLVISSLCYAISSTGQKTTFTNIQEALKNPNDAKALVITRYSDQDSMISLKSLVNLDRIELYQIDRELTGWQIGLMVGLIAGLKIG